ncbi:GL10356 [Drosophila persimilis]|uniref:GL10356 n=1 Tax=Drosophila persimilis TaxID=7234 RepID=B4GDH0_DROPE|nr:GL10356 [Drosophila persimilis]
MIPWMREKFNEKRAKWLSRSNRSATPHSPGSSRLHTASSASDAESLSSASLNVPTTETETQTDVVVGGRPVVGGGSCVMRTPSPARRRRMHLELQLHMQATHNGPGMSSAGGGDPLDTPTPYQQHENAKTCQSGRVDPEGSTGAEGEDSLKATDSITVRVICPSSRVLVFKTNVNKRLNDLKSEVILELSDDPDSIQLFAPDVRHLNPRYRLYRAEYYGAELNEAETLAQLQIQYDVRKVLISLAQASAAVLGAGPYAPRLITMLKQRLINRRNHQSDTLQCLVDMGFKREMAAFALKANSGIYSSTLEWLIQNQNEDILQEPNINMQQSMSSISPSAIVTNNETIENTAALMEIVRIYSHRDSPPSDEIVESLTEMGFEEAAVVSALKRTGNNKASACEWLCDNRTGSVIELREGLAPDSPILKVILEMPQVQMTLSNPKTFLAFLAILENEHAIRVWRGDNDTTSIITHILQKYHEEKHVLGINQFYTNRW